MSLLRPTFLFACVAREAHAVGESGLIQISYEMKKSGAIHKAIQFGFAESIRLFALVATANPNVTSQ
jgi:hypothetical protein